MNLKNSCLETIYKEHNGAEVSTYIINEQGELISITNKINNMSYTTDKNDKGVNKPKKDGQNETYLILSEKERAKGFIRPVRQSYVHMPCGVRTKMGLPLAETCARDPKFYGATFCVSCGNHYPVSEFTWDGTDIIVGT